MRLCRRCCGYRSWVGNDERTPGISRYGVVTSSGSRRSWVAAAGTWLPMPRKIPEEEQFESLFPRGIPQGRLESDVRGDVRPECAGSGTIRQGAPWGTRSFTSLVDKPHADQAGD
jgi:hypothetical protein